DADRSAYGLVEKRQREAFGQAADSKIGSGEVPAAVTPDSYDKTPPTRHDLPPELRDATSTPSTAPAATTTLPGTGGANGGGTMADSAETLLQARPDLKIDKMPDLPQFPRPAAAGKKYSVFTLDDCFNYSLGHARDYRTQKENLYIAALNVTLERHQFEPRLFAQTGAQWTRAGEAGDYAAALSATQSVGVKQKLPYGGEIVAQAVASSVNQLHEAVATGNTADLILQANIPLLRGAGMAAQENLIQSERNLIYAVRDFERYRRGFLVNVAGQYFNLVNQRAQIINRFRNVGSYIFITKRSQALFDAGRPRTSLLDVQRAAQSEFSARNDLINAIESYESALDNFKLLIGMPTNEPLDVAVQYLNITPPAIPEAQALEVAYALRLDLQTDRDQVEDARRGIKLAGNNLLPDLNVNAAADMANGRKWNIGPDGSNTSYAAGVTLDIPLDRLKERNDYRLAQINLDRAKRNVEQSQEQVSIDVRTALRQVRQQLMLLAIQKNNIDLAQKRKAFADIQFRDGKIDNRDYLDAESALLDAQNRFAQALSGLEAATLQYLRNTDQLRVDAQGRLQLPGEPGEPGGAATRPTVEELPRAATRPGK
ncbi:MAG: TolC family protein, partial [Phycisphaerae bacterium]